VSSLFLAAWSLVLRRAASDLLIVAAAFVTILLAATILAAGPIYANAVAASGLERTLADAPARDSGLQVSARIPLEDLERTSARVERTLKDAFGDASAPVYRSAVSDSYELPAARGREQGSLAVFALYDDLPAYADLVGGRWPSAGTSTEAVLSVGAARSLGLALGDSIELTSVIDESRRVPVTVGGIYRPRNTRHAFWWGSPLETQGSQRISFTTFGPFVVDRDTFARVAGAEAEARWRGAAPGDFTVESLPGLRERLDALGPRLEAATGRDPALDTGLRQVLERTDRLLTVTRSGVLIPLLQLAILAGAALLFLAGLLAERRGLESAILRSRGAGSDRIAGLALMEGALLALPAALVAPWLAALALRALNHVGPLAQIGLQLDPRVTVTSYVLAGIAAILCVGAIALPALRSSAVTSTVAARGRPATRSFFQTARLDLVLAALALLAYWQLRRYGGPVVEGVQGRLGIDPLLVAAPALGLIAGAVLALRLVPAVASLVERVAGVTRGPVGALGTRELARRPQRYANAALLLTLALAIGLFASAYSGTWLASQRDQADYQAGADVRVEPSKRSRAIPSMRLAASYKGLTGVRTALPVYRAPFEPSGSATATNLLAVDARRAAAVARFRGDLADRPLASVLAPLARNRPRLAAVPLPGEPQRLRLDVTVSVEPLRTDRLLFGTAIRPSVALVVRDADGVLYRLPATGFGITGAHRRVDYTLADAAGREPARYPLSLVAIETQALPSFRINRHLSVQVSELSVVSQDGSTKRVSPPGVEWRVSASQSGEVDKPPRVERVEGDAFFAIDVETGTVADFQTTRPVTFTATPRRNAPVKLIPAVATESFTAATGTASGARIPLGPDGPALGIAGTVRGFPTLPGAQGGVVVDFPTYAAASWLADGTVLDPSEWWIDVSGPAAPVADRLSAPPFSSERVLDRVAEARAMSNDPVALGISGALYFGFAAAAALAVIGFAVSSATSAVERRTEFAVLRSLGLSHRQLSGALALEGGLTAALALAAGTVLGLLLAWLVLPFVSLSDEGTRPFPGVIVHFPWATAAWFEGVLIAALALVVLLEIRMLGRVRLAPALRAGEDR
jgi:FtsX-like permease family